MVVVEKGGSLDDLFPERGTIGSPASEKSLIWLRQKTVSYDRPDGVFLLLTYDIYLYSSDGGKEIHELRYQPGLIPPF